ncbi:hypothetical protein ACOSQ2_013843 [Xanthoceras sorbifolium]
MATLSGIHLACASGFSSILVESDFKRVMDLINGVGSSRTELGIMIDWILDFAKRNIIISMLFIPRTSNSVAHSLAKLALSLADEFVLLEDLPESLQPLLLADIQAGV